MYKNQIQTKNETGSANNNVYVIDKKATNIEREVDQYISNIRSMISRVSPSQRQQYYNGLLAFILNEQEVHDVAISKSVEHKDLSALSVKELNLIEEMSVKMQQLHQLIGDDAEYS